MAGEHIDIARDRQRGRGDHHARRRAVDRDQDKRREGDLSDADLSVYQWMVNAQEPIEGPHIVMDTTQTPPDVLAERLKKYWFDREKHHTTTGFLTSPWTKPLG